MDGMDVGPFKLGRLLGRGGMATVWSGVHAELGTAVAFKFMRGHTDSPNSVDTLRLLNETRALARMRHPSIVQIFDAGVCSQALATHLKLSHPAPYLVMEAVSVIFQVVSFKSRGKRIFLMAPLHHHFEMKGWEEPKVVVRLWIIAIILGLLSISTLKLR